MFTCLENCTNAIIGGKLKEHIVDDPYTWEIDYTSKLKELGYIVRFILDIERFRGNPIIIVGRTASGTIHAIAKDGDKILHDGDNTIVRTIYYIYLEKIRD